MAKEHSTDTSITGDFTYYELFVAQHVEWKETIAIIYKIWSAPFNTD